MDLPELINRYKSYLEKSHSRITVKNYISDIKHFLEWFAKYQNTPFNPDLLRKNVISDYQAYLESASSTSHRGYSYKSSRRHLSTLRSFTAYLTSEAIIEDNPFELVKSEIKPDAWKIHEFKSFLRENSSSDLTIKYYINDLQSFIRWYEESVGPLLQSDFSFLNTELISEYSRRLQDSLLLSPKTINRKLSSMRRYLQYISIQQRLALLPELPRPPLKPEESVRISELTVDNESSSYSHVPPVRLVQKLTKPYLGFEDKAASIISNKIIKNRLRNTFHADSSLKRQKIDEVLQGLSGKNIKKEFYAPYSISTSEFPLRKKVAYHLRYTRPEWYKRYHTYPFVHYIHFGILVIAAMGAGLFLYQHTIGSATATDLATRSTLQRTFVFKGKLLDKNQQPLQNPTDLRLSLYTNPTASGSALTWQEVQTNIKPDENGNITVVIGSRTPLPDSLFQNNLPLYLGIAVGDSEELTPREPIGVPYATTAENVQGLSPITSSDKQTNVLLALDASGTLSIGGQANPVFQATGGQFTLSGNTVLLTTNAGSDGNVIINPTGNGKIDLQKPLTNSLGILTTEGELSISASSSANPALAINQDNGGPLLVASTSGEARFLVDSQGVIGKGIWAGTPISPEFGGFGGNITPATPGELLYSVSTTAYGHLRPGTAGQCLVTNGYAAPLWSSCGFLSQLNGALSMTNNTLDFLLGATSTGSAKFAFTNIGNGTPTLTINQGLSLTKDSIQANNQDLKIGGGTTKNVLLAYAGGNVGINTSNLTRSLDVNGTWGGNVDYYSDGAATQTVTREAHALMYDLEKDAGSAEVTTTTTYNIVGLPDTDGTFAYLYTKVSKGLTASNQQQTINIEINGASVGSVSTLNSTNSSTVIKHYTVTRTNGQWHLMGEPGDTDAADLAEWTQVSGPIPTAGTIMSVGTDGKLIPSALSYDSKIAGVVSTNPRIKIGLQTETSVPLALSGRVPVIIASTGGAVKSGDYITTSGIPGVGMRLNHGGPTVGTSLEGFLPTDDTCKTALSLADVTWPDDSGKNDFHPCFKIPVASFDALTRTQLQTYGLTSVDYLYIGKVMVLTRVSWSNSEDLLASINEAIIHDDSSVLSMSSLDTDLENTMDSISASSQVITTEGRVISKIEAVSGLVAGAIKAGTVTATTVATQKFYAAAAQISNLTVSDSLSAAHITSPLVSTDSLAVNQITPKDGKDIAIKLPETSAVTVKNDSTGKEVARIDASGNASFSGDLTSQSLQTTDASISGTLHAGKLIADSIDGLDQKVASIAGVIAASKPVPNAPLPHLSDALLQSSVSAQFGTFTDGLLSLGASTFGDISVMNQLSLGTTFILGQNSINTLGTDLAIQPLRQGAVSFLAGAVRIESDGRLNVSEDALFAKDVIIHGKLAAGIISPLADQDVSVNLPSSSKHSSSFMIHNASQSAVLAVSQSGDVIASGSGTFSKLNFNLVEQAQASGEFTATASTSAGTALLKANTTELTIVNPLVTAKSLIYITPAQNTNNNILYLMRQTANTTDGPNGSFTVGISKSVPQDTLFNWLIVN